MLRMTFLLSPQAKKVKTHKTKSSNYLKSHIRRPQMMENRVLLKIRSTNYNKKLNILKI